MVAFVFTYSVVWLVLILYVFNLGITQRRLMRTAATLQPQTANQEGLRRAARDDAAGEYVTNPKTAHRRPTEVARRAS
jgi:hypothetical protein